MRLPEDARGAQWALGLSGGADSVALLHKCLEAGVRPVALHFNHAFEDENGDENDTILRFTGSASHPGTGSNLADQGQPPKYFVQVQQGCMVTSYVLHLISSTITRIQFSS